MENDEEKVVLSNDEALALIEKTHEECLKEDTII